MSEEVGAKRWYAVHTYSGYENKVKKNLEKRVESMNMTEQIFRVVIPEEEETQVKDGKAKKLVKKTFPGYVLVELIMTDESWYVVRNRIQSGPFANQVGEVQEIEADKFKLTVLVDMFGRETPVEVEFDQIEKL
ncbi:MAG: transcription termination/antitermination NusG family protein [Staphylococcus epidermidis]|nr:transcription termination/antitermination NusG family protein [Staphylococcus epidermidis]